MSELKTSNASWTSFCQLVQQVMAGSVRRNTFTPREMEFLLDLQMAPIRKSSRPEVLRRYLREVQQQMQSGAPVPLRFSRFYEAEGRRRNLNDSLAATLPRAS